MKFLTRAYTGLPLGLVSGGVVVYEIGLTRLFSFLLHYHFTFLVVSGAVCGLGIGAMLASRWSVRGAGGLAAAALALALGLWGATVVVAAWPRLPTAALLAVAGLPFVLAGAFIAWVFRARAADSQRLYFCDLAGAALGILWVVPALKWLGGVETLASAALAAALAALVLAAAAPGRARLPLTLATAAGVLFFGLQCRTPLVGINTEALARAADKPMFRALGAAQNTGSVAQTRWSAYARTDVVDRTGDTGLNIYMDGGAGSYMFRFGGDARRLAFVRQEAAFFPYYFAPRGRALILGPGGGADVLYALMTGWREIEAVEINPEIVDLVHEYGDYNGHIFARDNVQVYRSDGRNYAERAEGPYDLVALPLVYAEAADLVGFQLLENYLFTREAFASYLEKLRPGGRLALVVHNHALMLRAVATLASLYPDGAGVALDRLVVLNGRRAQSGGAEAYRPLLLFQKTPYTADQLHQIEAGAVELGLKPHFVPGRTEVGDLARLRGEEMEVWAAGLRHAVGAVSDARPFFYRTRRDLDGGLLGLLWGAALAVVLLVGWRARTRAADGGEGAATAFFAAGLGAAYMLVEIFLLQRFALFLGYPTLSLAVTLFALLFASAVGSLLGGSRPALGTYRGVALWAGGCAAAVVLFGGVQALALPAALSWPIEARVLLTLALVAPLGMCMGVCYPALLRLEGARRPHGVAWIWGINGAASVLGSSGAVALALVWGTGWGLWAGAAVYAMAAAVLWLGARSGAAYSAAPVGRGALALVVAAAVLWYGVFTWVGNGLWGQRDEGPSYPPPAVHPELWPRAIDPGF